MELYTLKKLLEEKLEDVLRALDAFIVDIEYDANTGKLRLFIDTDTGITAAQCATISRALLRSIQEDPDFQGISWLEVSSPGLDRPLKTIRQYQKNIGREVRVQLHQNREVEGTLLAVEENAIVIGRWTVKGEFVEERIPFAEIHATKIVVKI